MSESRARARAYPLVTRHTCLALAYVSPSNAMPPCAFPVPPMGGHLCPPSLSHPTTTTTAHKCGVHTCTHHCNNTSVRQNPCVPARCATLGHRPDRRPLRALKPTPLPPVSVASWFHMQLEAGTSVPSRWNGMHKRRCVSTHLELERWRTAAGFTELPSVISARGARTQLPPCGRRRRRRWPLALLALTTIDQAIARQSGDLSRLH